MKTIPFPCAIQNSIYFPSALFNCTLTILTFVDIVFWFFFFHKIMGGVKDIKSLYKQEKACWETEGGVN